MYNIPGSCASYLHVANLGDQTEAEEIGKNFRNVINNGSNAKQGGGSTVVLQVPEQERKDESYTKSHKPGHKQKWDAFEILELP